MKATVKMNQRALKTLSAALSLAAVQTANHMLAEEKQDQVMPRDTGNLQNMRSYVDGSKAKVGTVEIVHDTPYANRVYFHPEYNFRTDKNANARGEWWEPWIAGDKKDKPKKLFKKFYKLLSGGFVR
jgi:hypothetical protein